MPFEVIVLGVGDAFSDRFHPSALLLCCDGFQLAVDCPDQYRKVLREAGETCGRTLSASDVDACLVTHLHGDHVNGLEGLAFFKRFVDREPLPLLTLPEVREALWPGRLGPSMGVLWDGTERREHGFEDYFRHTPVEPGRQTSVGPFRIAVHRTQHHIPTAALRVTAAGRTFGYSADTTFDPELISFLASADCIVHETNLGPAHTAYAELAALDAGLRSRMHLIHYPDGFEESAPDIALCRQGEVLLV